MTLNLQRGHEAGADLEKPSASRLVAVQELNFQLP